MGTDGRRLSPFPLTLWLRANTIAAAAEPRMPLEFDRNPGLTLEAQPDWKMTDTVTGGAKR